MLNSQAWAEYTNNLHDNSSRDNPPLNTAKIYNKSH